MKRVLLLVCAAVLTTVLFGYSVPLTSSPDATAPSTAASAAGWTCGARTPSAAGAGDFRQMSFADSLLYQGSFDSDSKRGLFLVVR